ncbi:MAG TPA: ankyrin repeat domain-containing protein [Pyrinomonadaceae bacterium]|nr:ankyrin repeat domain-containing protein [Pyrinomonadaceae bacterium]
MPPQKISLALFLIIISLATIATAQVTNPPNPNLDEALLGAARVGDTNKIRTTLQDGAKVNAKDNAGKTALMLAAEGGYTEAVRALLRQNASTNQQDNSGQTALMLAAGATGEYVDVVRFLLRGGALPGIKNRNSKTALQLAVEKDHDNIVRLFLERGNRFSSTDVLDAFVLALTGGQRRSADEFLESGVDPNTRDSRGYTVVMLVTMQNNNNAAYAVETLVRAGADVHLTDSRENTALLNAAAANSAQGVKALLQNGVDARDVDGERAIWTTVQKGYQYVVAALIEAGGDAGLVDGSTTNTLLMFAADKGHEGTAKVLIKGGANVNAQNRNGDTALMFAARNGRRDIVKLLRANNADAGIVNNDGKTALVLAQENNHKDTVKELSK